MSNATTAQTASAYIGKCKTKGCRTAIRINYRDVQNITAAQYKAREFDQSSAFMIHGVRPFGFCSEHGAYAIKFLQGRYSHEHECDARCMGATGPSCDCSCGGANHGANHA